MLSKDKILFILALTFSMTTFAENYTPVSIAAKNTKLFGDNKSLTPCQRSFAQFAGNHICFDYKDGSTASVNDEVSCTINPDAKNVPYFWKGFCDGEIHQETTMTTAIAIRVADKNNPHQIKMNYVHMQFGICSIDFKDTDIAALAGNIYTCDPITGKFELSRF